MRLKRFPDFSSFMRVVFLLHFLFLGSTGCAENFPPVSAEINAEKSQKETLSPRDTATFFSYVTDRLRREYVEPVTNDKLLEGALNGILSCLDPHSAYLDPKHFEEVKKQTQGKYGGLGLEMMMEGGLVRVISAIPDTPAAKAGIQTDDFIVMINDEPVLGLNVIEAAEKLRGDPHTTVKLTIRRHQTEQFDLTLTREDINIKPVDWRVEGEIGYIRIKTFNNETTFELHQSIKDIKAALGNKLRGFVIDLRNNPGGLLDQAISVSDTFLNKGEIVSIRGRDSHKATRFDATPVDVTEGLPLVILINGGTASASEIVAGALQDHHRAIIVGTRSFGKGSVQNVVPLNNGGALKFTTALYYTPSGRTIQKQGIMPDVVVEQLVDLKTIKEDSRFRESNFSTAIDLERLKGQAEPKTELTPKMKTSMGEEKTNAGKDDKPSTHTPLKKNDLLKPLKDYQLEQALNVMKVITLLGHGAIALKINPGLTKRESMNAARK